MHDDTLYDKYSRLKNRNFEKDFNELIWPMRKHIGATLSHLASRHGRSAWGRKSNWVPAALADRVDRLEEMVGSARHGHLPDFLSGHSLHAQLGHNRKSLLVTAASAAVLGAVTYSFLNYRKKKKEKEIIDWDYRG